MGEWLTECQQHEYRERDERIRAAPSAAEYIESDGEPRYKC